MDALHHAAPFTEVPPCPPPTVQGHIQNWRLSMCACTSLLAAAALLFTLALCQAGVGGAAGAAAAAGYREVAESGGADLLLLLGDADGEGDIGSEAEALLQSAV